MFGGISGFARMLDKVISMHGNNLDKMDMVDEVEMMNMVDAVDDMVDMENILSMCHGGHD